MAILQSWLRDYREQIKPVVRVELVLGASRFNVIHSKRPTTLPRKYTSHVPVSEKKWMKNTFIEG